MLKKIASSLLLGLMLVFSPLAASAQTDTTPPQLTQPPVVSTYSSGSAIAIEFHLNEPCYIFHFYLDYGYGFQMVGQWGPYAGQSLNPASISSSSDFFSTGRPYYMDCTDAAGNKLTTGNYVIGTPVCAWWDIFCVLAPIIDSTPPVITQVAHSNVTPTGARFTWTTDEDSATLVEFGATTAYGSSISDTSTLVKSHQMDIVSLQPNTAYHYRVASRDNAGNSSQSADFTFTTPLPPPPVISGVSHGSITSTSATISWTTSSSADSTVEYGDTTYEMNVKNASMSTSHSLVITGLAGGRSYVYRVRSKDASGQESVSENAATQKFTTPAQSASSAPGGSGGFTVTAPKPLLQKESLLMRFPAGTNRFLTIEEKNELGFVQYSDVWVRTGVTLPTGVTPVIFDAKYAAVKGIVDGDHDGLPDTQETTLGTKTNNQDSDGDGLTDGFEVYISKTSPLKTDTDGDGASDEKEVMNKTLPNDPTSK